VQPSDIAVHRPLGQLPGGRGHPPQFGPSQRLDLELEIGCYIGAGNRPGTAIPIADAGAQIAGLCLLNDWSARDIQAWEMMPLGPFLAKNFATTVSPWVVTLEALAPFRIPQPARPDGDPAPLPYLLDAEDQASGAFDIRLGVALRSAQMRQAGESAVEIIVSNTRHLYWTLAQMVAHHSVGGCNLRPGDLLGSGTISGPTRAELSSMLELTFGGSEKISLPNGELRGFLQDGDEITLSGRCTRQGFVSIGFGSCRATLLPSSSQNPGETR
jgi:fumarylacetoacetase